MSAGDTVILLLAEAVLKAVVPPVGVVRSAVPPTVPLVWSQAWKVIPSLTLPLQLAFGTKRT